MSLLVKHMQWDSDFFKFPVVRFECDNTSIHDLNEYIIKCSDLGVKLIYLFVQPGDIKSISNIQSINAKLVDRKVTYLRSINTSVMQDKVEKNISITDKFSLQLEYLAFQSGEFSRFRLDNNFPAKSYERMYTQWLVNSLNGKIANNVLVYKDDFGKEIGFLTLGEKNNRADIGLLSVDINHRGKKIGQKLVQEAKNISAQNGYTEMQVVTQFDNSLACAFYEKCDFQYECEEYIYHLWLS